MNNFGTKILRSSRIYTYFLERTSWAYPYPDGLAEATENTGSDVD